MHTFKISLLIFSTVFLPVIAAIINNFVIVMSAIAPILAAVVTVILTKVFRKLEVIRVDVNSNLTEIKRELVEALSRAELAEGLITDSKIAERKDPKDAQTNS